MLGQKLKKKQQQKNIKKNGSKKLCKYPQVSTGIHKYPQVSTGIPDYPPEIPLKYSVQSTKY